MGCEHLGEEVERVGVECRGVFLEGACVCDVVEGECVADDGGAALRSESAGSGSGEREGVEGVEEVAETEGADF